MEKEIVYTDKYALILSDEKIKEGDWFFEKAGRLGPFCFSGSKANFHMKKIIAHLPLSDAPILEGVPLLPFQQPSRPTHFECEMEDKIAIDGHTLIGSEAKTTTNSQGQIELVGKYLIK